MSREALAQPMADSPVSEVAQLRADVARLERSAAWREGYAAATRDALGAAQPMHAPRFSRGLVLFAFGFGLVLGAGLALRALDA